MIRRFLVPRCRLLVLFAAVVGCNPSGASLTPVKGKVTVDGQPVTSGHVVYVPTDATDTAGLSAGTIDSNGEYTISTGGKSGAPLGKYKVMVSPNTVPVQGATAPAGAFNAQYQDPKKTPLTKEVVSSAAPGAYDLQLTK